MYTVNNKFEIGEECFTTVRKVVKCECPVCKGKGKFTYNGYEIKCKQCEGTGKIDTHQTIVAPCKVQVRRMKATIWKDVIAIKYMVNLIATCKEDALLNVRNRQENGLFKTFEEAEEYCADVNSGQI